MNVDIKKLKNIKEELDNLSKDDVLYVEEKGISKYVLLPIELYDEVEDIVKFSQEMNKPQVKIVNNSDIELSYEEYEQIKSQIMEAVDKTFKPKPEKLN